MSNQELAKELNKPNVRKFEKRKVYSSFKNNILEVDLVHMQLTSISNKGLCFLLFTIDIFSKYSLVVPLKDKKGIITIASAFQKVLDESNCKLTKIWVDKSRECYNRSMKSRL